MDERGQSIVEVALVIPVFFLAVVVCMKVFFLCRNVLILQATAATAARQMALGDLSYTGNAALVLETYQYLSDSTTFPQLRHSSQQIQPWRPFRGLDVVTTPGYLVSAHLSCSILPQIFLRWWLPVIPLRYDADWPSEPPVPPEK